MGRAICSVEKVRQGFRLFLFESEPTDAHLLTQFLLQHSSQPWLRREVLLYEYGTRTGRHAALYYLLDGSQNVLATLGLVPKSVTINGTAHASLALERACLAAERCSVELFHSFYTLILNIEGTAAPFQWSLTENDALTAAKILQRVNCLVDLHIVVSSASRKPSLMVSECTAEELLQFFKSVAVDAGDRGLIVHTLEHIKWLIYENPFVNYIVLRLGGGSRIDAVAVVRTSTKGHAVVEEVQSIGTHDLSTIVGTLAGELFRRGFPYQLFKANALSRFYKELSEALKIFNVVQRSSAMPFFGSSAIDAEGLREWNINGLWSVPYLGSEPRSKVAVYLVDD